jgi:hypothetical protein
MRPVTRLLGNQTLYFFFAGNRIRVTE